MLLDVTNLTVFYQTLKVLDNISLNIKEGEIIALIGPNGAGKSTTLKAVVGLLSTVGGHIEQGKIIYEGKIINGLQPHTLVKEGITLIPEGRHIFSTMTVLENLEMGGFSRSDKATIKKEIDYVLGLFPQLNQRIKQKAGSLSTGEQQMLALGRALMLKPRLLLADEPSLGLSPNFVDLIFDKLVEINHNGTSILLVEQNAQMALEVCHRGYVFELGKIVLEGERKNLVKNEKIKKVYLGG